MTKTTPIGTFRTWDGVNAAAELVRANAIRCAVVPLPTLINAVVPAQGSDYGLVVATEDAGRAREAIDGFLEAAWFLCTPDGRRVHAFETATAQRLRRHAAGADPDGWAARDCERLADLLEAGGVQQVGALFRRERTVEGRTLAEWARGCGCEPVDAGV